jgi:hypothetical protein
MKTLLFTIATLLVTTSLSANELSWVDEQVQAIKPPRMGMTKNELSRIHDPFIFLKKNKEESPKSTKSVKQLNSNTKSSVFVQSAPSKTHSRRYKLSVIINKSYMINKKWYKLGEKIDGYTITAINSTSVLLKKRKKKSLLLTTRSSKQKLKLIN